MTEAASRVRVSVDLDAFRRNLRRIRALLHPRVHLLLVVKKNAYGHGLIPIARAARAAGADWLGVFSAAEGIALRRAGIRLPVLVFSVTPAEELDGALRHRLVLTITDGRSAREADRGAARLRLRAAVHLKVDTGMGRLGLDPQAVRRAELAAIEQCTNLHVQGLYSHLACADTDADCSHRQLARLLELVPHMPPSCETVHLGASAALRHPEFHLDMVRVGIAAYGGLPGFEPVMRVTAPVLQVKEVAAGCGISYGHTYRTRRRTRVGLVGAGYGDGYFRSLSNRGWVWLRGREARLLGRVCMDQFMVDVTRVPGVAPGDEVELLGPHVLPHRLAEAAGTISNELFCSLGNSRARMSP